MPYRSDGRSDDLRDARAAELAVVLEGAELRVRAAAGKLKVLEERLDAERRELDLRGAEAQDAIRRGVHRALANREPAAGPQVRDALRTQATVNALERAMARARKRPAAALPTLEEARAAMREARGERAWLAARREASLEAARARLGEAVADHDDAAEACAAEKSTRGE